MNTPLRRIEVGDFSPTIKLPSQTGGKVWAFDTSLAGRPVAYIIFRNASSTATVATLEAFKNCFAEFQEIGARVVGISNLFPVENGQLAQNLDLPFSFLSDVNGDYAASYGLPPGDDAIACAVLDRNCRLLKLLSGSPGTAMATQALKICGKESTASEGKQVKTQAPVLLIPRVFEPDFCKQLIKFWRQGDKAEDQITQRAEDGQSDKVSDVVKRRTDVLVPEGDHPVNLEIRRRLSMRVIPELEKAFDHHASRYELARIGCYESAKKGFFRAHRDLYHGDTVTPRRFAMSLNLNDEFEGGDVRFAEYGMQTYRAPLGGGLVFSCRLLHEVTPVTKGKRFTLLLFFN